jgi:Kef-type K+ transport system membrane component KefB
VFAVIAQVTIADVITILSVPIVLQPSRVQHAALGALLVAGVALLVLAGARRIDRLRGGAWVHRVRALSKRRRWALDLRLSLLVLFVLAWLAVKSGTSILIAGFGAGLTVAALGGPKRLSTQVRGIGDGFFIPLYFVVLGSRLDLAGLVRHPTMLALAAALTALNVLIHLLATTLLRRPPTLALLATAQLGVPAAVASLGISEHVLSPVIATAIVASALFSLLICTLGVERLAAAPGAQVAFAAGPGATQAASGSGSS